ncbi:MAG: hypothetical protein IT376_02705 [Polyangiaceae bacterium]|nr:hypothetical protein [Polyangiaceae bacterium]
MRPLLVAAGSLAWSLACSRQPGAPPPPTASVSVGASSAAGPGPAEAARSAGGPQPTAPARPWAPGQWEDAYQATRGPEPTKEYTEEPIPPPYPDCANHSARVMLRAKHQQAHEDATRAITLRNRARAREAEEAHIRARGAHFAHTQALDGAAREGFFLRPRPTTRGMVRPVGVGASTPLEPTALTPPEKLAPVVDRLAASELAAEAFECTALGATRVPRPRDARESFAAPGADRHSQVDLLACTGPGDSRRLAIVVELPLRRATARLAAGGDQATVESYSLEVAPFTEAALRARLDAAATAQGAPDLRGAKVRIGGASRLRWFLHGAPAYAWLQERGMERRLAIETAEYKNLWYVTFDYQCRDEGLDCPAHDGLARPSAALVQPGASAGASAGASGAPPAAVPVPTPSPDPTPRGGGRWEDAAREADPELLEASHTSPLSRSFAVASVAGAATLERLVAPGGRTRVVPGAEPLSPIVEAFRGALGRRGGAAPFTCKVIDFGYEVNPPPWPPIDQARTSLGLEDAEPPMLNIICLGAEDGYRGEIFVYVPVHAAWAVVRRSADVAEVEQYELERHGYLAEELRGKLLEVGRGTELELTGVARLKRAANGFSAFGYPMSSGTWVAHLGKHQCPHRGLGCDPLDGMKLPAVTAKRLVPCEVHGFVYPAAQQ